MRRQREMKLKSKVTAIGTLACDAGWRSYHFKHPDRAPGRSMARSRPLCLAPLSCSSGRYPPGSSCQSRVGCGRDFPGGNAHSLPLGGGIVIVMWAASIVTAAAAHTLDITRYLVPATPIVALMLSLSGTELASIFVRLRRSDDTR